MYFAEFIVNKLSRLQRVSYKEAHIERAYAFVRRVFGILQEVARYYNLTIPNPSLQSISDAFETKTKLYPLKSCG